MEPVIRLGLAVFAPLITGVLTLFLPRSAFRARVALALLGPVAAGVLVAMHIAGHGVVSLDAPTATSVLPWIPSLNLNLAFLPDGLGLFFAMLVAGVGSLIVLYARSYFGKAADDLYRFYPTLGFFTTAMLGIVLADYTLLTLLFWELTSISSFLLIGWDRYDKNAVKLGMQAFFTTGLGGMAMFGGILLFGQTTGIWRWSDMLAQAPELIHGDLLNSTPMLWAFGLIFLGAATKSAQFPFHYWLPGAMAAPTPVSAFLHSATMVKAGVFLTGRLFPVFSHLDIWPWVIIPLGGITMLLGAMLAVNQHDLKRIFAYTTVSQLGLLMCMYGLGGVHFEAHHVHLAAIDWDITQIANHAFYKAPLFILAGAIGHLAGTRELPRLFGYWKQHKAAVFVMLMAGYALAAGPGTISFQAKELFIYAVYHAAEVHPAFWVLMAMTVLTAMCNVAIFIRLFTTLLGLPRGLCLTREQELAYLAKEEAHGHEHEEHHHEHGFWGAMLWVPALLIVLPQYIGGLYTPIWNQIFSPLESNFNYFDTAHGLPALWQLHMSTPLLMSAIAIAGGVVLGLSGFMRGAVIDVFDRVYPGMYWLAVTGGRHAFGLVQTGNLRHYITFVFLALLVAFAGALVAEPEMVQVVTQSTDTVLESWPGLLLGVLACVTALAIPLTPSRVLRVLLLGSCGFSVVGLYLICRAPDLALTQVMVETISVILFVLVLRLLPERDVRPSKGIVWRAALSIMVGIVFGWMTLVAATSQSGPVYEQPRLGNFFAEHSYEGTEATDMRGGGGENIVNVILVDFRGFDTLGEITVLAVAAMGVWSLFPALKRNRYQPKKLQPQKELV